MGKKRFLIEIILSSIAILLIIAVIILIILIRAKRPKKYSEFEVNDVRLFGLESFNFITYNSTPEYPSDNLGYTGDLILNCYTGTCTKKFFHRKKWIFCDIDDDCYDETDENWTRYNAIIDHNCSEQCFNTRKKECYCYMPYNVIGKCESKIDNEYSEGKVCIGDNIIYFWKGKKYEILNISNYSYFENVKLKEEECPKGTKSCGIIDKDENKLCIETNLPCPINYISDKKSDTDYSSVIIGNKNFYYGYDGKKNTKIIKGLVADTDLYLNENSEENEIIDTNTIRDFLNDNQNLYRNNNLGYDPYKEEDINKKGKSYLRINYNEYINLYDLRKRKEEQIFNHTMNTDIINPIHKKTKLISIMGLITCGLGLIIFTIYLIYQCYCYKRGYNDGEKGYYACGNIIFLALILTPLIFGCKNINKANKGEELDSNHNFNTFRLLNKVFVIIGFILFAFLIIYIILVPIKCKCKFFKKRKDNEQKRKGQDEIFAEGPFQLLVRQPYDRRLPRSDPHPDNSFAAACGRDRRADNRLRLQRGGRNGVRLLGQHRHRDQRLDAFV